MVQHHSFRTNPELTQRIVSLAEARETTQTHIIKIALDIGLQTLESGRHVNPVRTAILLEFIAAHADMIGKTLYPDDAETVPSVVSQRMEQYHGVV